LFHIIFSSFDQGALPTVLGNRPVQSMAQRRGPVVALISRAARPATAGEWIQRPTALSWPAFISISASTHLVSVASLTRSARRPKWRARVYRKLRLKVHSKAWVRVDLNSDAGQHTLSRLRDECVTGQVAAGAGTVTEHLDAHESNLTGWGS
jgi:hypothetical protein